MTLKEVKAKLNTDSVSVRYGIFTARQGFFYRHGGSEEKLADRIKAAIPQAEIIGMGEHYTAFIGGAPLHKQSHWWVKFKV